MFFLLLLKRSPMKMWSAVVIVLSLIMLIVECDLWIDSYTMSSVRWFVPMVYFAGILSVGAAYSEKKYLETSREMQERLSSRSIVRLNFLHVTPVLVYGIILPLSILGTLVWGGAFFFGAHQGKIFLGYFVAELFFLIALVFLGMFIARIVETTVYALLIALVVSFAMTFIFSPVPPSNKTWLDINPVLVFITIIFACVLVVLYYFSVYLPAFTRYRFLPWLFILILLVGVYGVDSGVEKQIQRTDTENTVCEQFDDGTQICVWKGDEFYIPQLHALIARANNLIRATDMGKPYTHVFEPKAGKEKGIMVKPEGPDDGMWLVAGEIFMRMVSDYDEQMYTCDMDKIRSDVSDDEYILENWLLAEVAENYIYGAKRPDTVHMEEGEISRYLDKQLKDFDELTDEERLDLFVQTQEKIGAMCRG